MQKQLTGKEVLAKIQDVAANKQEREVKYIEQNEKTQAKKGEEPFFGRQGDVQVMIGEVTWNPRGGELGTGQWESTGNAKCKHGDILAEGESVQVAVGEGMGARHIMTGGKGVRVYAPTDTEDPIRGPIVVIDEGCEGLLTHPEHVHFKLGPGHYSIGFQQDHAAKERARLAD